MKTILFLLLFLPQISFSEELTICEIDNSNVDSRKAVIYAVSAYNKENYKFSEMSYPDEYETYALPNGEFLSCGVVETKLKEQPEPKKITCKVSEYTTGGLFGGTKWEISRVGALVSYTAGSRDEYKGMLNLIGCQKIIK